MKALRLFCWLALLTGGVYPITVWALANLTIKNKAQGSLFFHENRVAGSFLIGQKFENEGFFWSRPSATDYDTLPSQGSNLGPTSTQLQKQVMKRREFWKSKNGLEPIPSDLLFASASGLDPHISLKAALYQVERIATARKMDKEHLTTLVHEHMEKKNLGVLGVPKVNVVKLNRFLSEMELKNE